jgi:hypothetical protein
VINENVVAFPELEAVGDITERQRGGTDKGDLLRLSV